MNALMQKAEVAYGWFLKAVNGLQSPFLLLIRVYWGWLFLQSGIGKFGHIDKVVSFFTDLGIPAPTLNAYFNASLETVGGILLDSWTGIAADRRTVADQHDRGLYHC